MIDPTSSTKTSVKIVATILMILLAGLSIEGAARALFYFKPTLGKMSGVGALLQLEASLDPYEIPAADGSYHWRLQPGYDVAAEHLVAVKKSQNKSLGAAAFRDDLTVSSDIIEDTPLRINSDGFRGPEIDPDKSRTRVLMLGDSVTFGLAKTTYPRAAAKSFLTLGRDYEVINGGVEGYSVQNLEVEMERYLQLRPDIVTIFIGWNDIYASVPWQNAWENRFASFRAINLIRRIFVTRHANEIHRASMAHSKRQDPRVTSLAGYKHPAVARVSEIAKQFRLSGSKVFVISLPGLFSINTKPSLEAFRIGHLPHFTDNSYVLAMLTKVFNQNLRANSAAGDYYMIDAEAWSENVLKPRHEYFSDSVHLRADGLRLLGKFIATTIDRVLGT